MAKAKIIELLERERPGKPAVSVRPRGLAFGRERRPFARQLRRECGAIRRSNCRWRDDYVFSLFINLLLLIPSIYMLQVYDRVLPSSSESTLLMLTLIVLFLFIVMGGLEWTRTQIMNATGNKLDNLLNIRIYNALFAKTLAGGGKPPQRSP